MEKFDLFAVALSLILQSAYEYFSSGIKHNFNKSLIKILNIVSIIPNRANS